MKGYSTISIGGTVPHPQKITLKTQKDTLSYLSVKIGTIT